MTRARLVPVLVFLVFLSFPPTFSGQVAGIIQITRRTIPFFKGVKAGMKWYDRAKNVAELFQNVGVVTATKEEDPTLNDIYQGMSTFELGVGSSSSPQDVTALLSISSLLTWISGYQPINDVPCCGFTDTNSICCAECGATCQSYKGYYLVKDRFTFYSIGYLDSYFEGSLTGPSDSASAVGVISFSTSPYSVVSNLQTKQFSYFFSFNSTQNSSISLGDDVSSIPRSELQSTQLIQDPNPNPNSYYYFVDLAQISVGDNSVAINAKTDFTYGVILDTIIPVTLLAEPAYEKVKSEIVAQMGQPVASNSFEMCYDNSPHWPILTLSFSGYAQMVLRKENYVVTDDDAGLECVAILPTSPQGISVIGIMAQLDRQMIFDVEQSKLYFDQYPDIMFSCDTKLTIALNLVVVYFILLLLCW